MQNNAAFKMVKLAKLLTQQFETITRENNNNNNNNNIREREALYPDTYPKKAYFIQFNC